MSRLRACATPATTPPDLLVALAGTPQYGNDPLSTEGTHRQRWTLSGWELAGRKPENREHYVYVLRFDVNGTSSRTFAAATVRAGGINGAGAYFVTLHREDYDGGCTLQGARDKAAAVLAATAAA